MRFADEVYKMPSTIKDEDLPASFRPDTNCLVLPSSDLASFLEADLSVKKIDRIGSQLWMVGRPYLPRPLNIQLVLDRQIIPTTDASLHLVWTSKKIFLKPLPSYILSLPFYERYLGRSNPHGPALGLLYSYLALVPTELDFNLASSAHLFPSEYKWVAWRNLTRQVLEDHPTATVFDSLPPRYRYGELRLSRLDKIYQVLLWSWLHGYSPLTGNTRYADFFAQNLSIIATTIVYVALVLTAMGVGLATDGLKEKVSFQRACYGFTVLAILLPIVGVGLVSVVFLFMFTANFARTIVVQRRRSRQSSKSLAPAERSRVDTVA